MSSWPSITVLINAKAGAQGGSDAAQDLSAAFASAGVPARIVAVASGDGIVERAREAAEVSEVVVAAGGDGTVSAVAGVLAGSGTTLGVLPLGTLNHFAKDMKLPLDPHEAIAVIAAGRATVVDAAEVNGRVFVNNSSIGVYPSIVEIREQLRRAGHRKWPAMAIAIWRVLRTYRGVRVRLTADGRQIDTRTPFVFIGNNEYLIEGHRVGAREHLNGGRLFVTLAPRIKARQLPMLLLRALLGGAQATEAFEIIHTTALQIDARHAHHMTVSLDGETAILDMPLHYQARPGALRVLA